MANLLPSLAIQTCCLNCQAAQSYKLTPFSQYVYGNKISCFDKLDRGNKLFCREQQNVPKSSFQNLNSKVYATSRVSIDQTEERVTTITELEDLKKASTYLFRTDTGGQSSATDARKGMNLNTFTQYSFDRFGLEMEFDAKQIPFYFSFLLKSSLDAEARGSEIKSHRKTNFCVPVGFLPGYPAPLGLSFLPDGSMNFSIFSRNMENVVLCLYDDTTVETPALELELDPYVNRSGDIWHVSFESAWTFGYFQRTLDRLCKEPAFDWADDFHPNLPMENLIVYTLNVPRFTQHKSSQLPTDLAGTFSGLAEKLQHLKDLGVNAVLLEPVLTYDEETGPYFPCHFFSPMNLCGPSAGPVSTINSMKEMVKKLHANGIEVIMEVVFTNTAKDGALQGIDDVSYYHANGVKDSEVQSDLNCNYPIVQQLVLDSLRHWVTEFHIDGFCFINASSLLRGFHGECLSRPPLVEAIAFDPLLSKTKIIADFWDPYEMVTKETHFPHWMKWAEINTRFCNDVRNFLRGKSILSNLATRLCGSGDIFSDGRGPGFSFNFIARNSGLPLVDVVSFSDGDLAAELSWNCGVPVLNMGDECGQSSGGSPFYNDRKPFDWNAIGTGFGIQTTQFILFLSSLRKRRSDLLQRRSFLNEENIEWHGSDLSPPSWEDPSRRFLAMTLKVDKVEDPLISKASDILGNLYFAVNAANHSETLVLPPLPEGMSWSRLVDTALPFPGFFSTKGEPVLEQMAA
ncbi:isoamylase 2, chloroplastic [Quillaja saponaria]|uniref:Isoamylase 2, chloroplastic n=1 Tax=Quillaja saponaria TaxID=32244 RepID=A0AAD7LLT9_QUISA|nr:isoamylase 2, chloroplastic [Quillaja saponaria]